MKFLPILIAVLLFSCNDSSLLKEFSKTKSDLEHANKAIKMLNSQIEAEGNLVHVVLFKLKPDADHMLLFDEIKKLENIEEVMDLEVGSFEDVGDARALSDYSVMMQMSFKDKKAYEVYQKHPIHLKLKENAKPLMSAPPATYDFFKK